MWFYFRVQPSEILALVFGVVTAIGVGVAVLTYLQQNPRRGVTLSTKETRFISEKVDGLEGIVISHSGQEVNDPRLIDVSIQATGRFDVPSERFDASNPLVMKCGSDILTYVGGDAGSVKIGEDRRSIEVGPMLLKKGVPMTITLLVDGAASCTWKAPTLIDTKVQVVDDTAKALAGQRMRKRRLILSAVLLAEVVAIAVMLLILALRTWV